MLLLFVPKNILQILSIDQACYVSGMIVGSIPGTDWKKTRLILYWLPEYVKNLSKRC